MLLVGSLACWRVALANGLADMYCYTVSTTIYTTVHWYHSMPDLVCIGRHVHLYMDVLGCRNEHPCTLERDRMAQGEPNQLYWVGFFLFGPFPEENMFGSS